MAELERRLRMDSTDSGTPTSKEPIGAKERRRAERQESERERRKDRRRGGQPGHPGGGLARDPDPGERKDADPPAQCRRCGAGLDGAAPAAPGWAQVVDVQVTRTVTEWALPGLQCPCCGTATIAAPPSGAHAGSVSYGPALNAAAVVLTSYGNVPPERAAHVVDMLLGVPVSAGWVDKASARLSRQLEQAGFDAAMCAALAAEPVLAADETPVNVLAPGAPAQAAGQEEEDPEDGGQDGVRRAARAGHPDPGRAADLAAGPGVAAEGGRHRRGAATVHRVPDHRRVQGLPAAAALARRRPAVLSARHQEVPRRHETRPRQPAVLGRRRDQHPARGAPGGGGSPRPRGHRPGPRSSWRSCASATTRPPPSAITHNRLRDWHDGNHPGYALGCWLQEYKEQVWLFTREFAVEWTRNSAERAVKGPKRHQAVSGYWHTQRTLARWCRIRSYLDSARNHGLRALDAIRAVLEGKPWLPLLPALA